ncbi:MAG: DUF2125 domain-containing protein [Alphaproteobacteria bacterium]
MKRAAFVPRTLFIATITSIVVLAILGWGFWTLAASQYRRIIDGWVEEGRAAGYQISYDDRQVFGFPRRITMRLVNLHWKNASGIDFHTDDMDIVVTPWDWSDFDAKFKNHASIVAPLDSEGHSLLLSASAGRAHAHVDSDGLWRAAKLSLSDAEIGVAPNYLFQAEKLSAAVSRPETPPHDHSTAGLLVEGEADAITVPAAMPSPFGNKAAKFSTHMRVMGPVPDVRRRADVDAWSKDSGLVEFDDFSMNWGVLELTSKGAMGFDDDLQPEGAFAGTVGNSEKTVQALMDGGFILIHDKAMLMSALDLFAKPSIHGGKTLDLPITVQLGGLFFGPIRIFTFPEIEWPVEPPVVVN